MRHDSVVTTRLDKLDQASSHTFYGHFCTADSLQSFTEYCMNVGGSVCLSLRGSVTTVDWQLTDYDEP